MRTALDKAPGGLNDDLGFRCFRLRCLVVVAPNPLLEAVPQHRRKFKLPRIARLVRVLAKAAGDRTMLRWRGLAVALVRTARAQ